jgi:hypothetical protein
MDYIIIFFLSYFFAFVTTLIKLLRVAKVIKPVAILKGTFIFGSFLGLLVSIPYYLMY